MTKKRIGGKPLSMELGVEVIAALSRMNRALRALRLPANLTHERLSALRALHRADSLSLSELAQSEGVTQGTMSRIATILDEQALVRRRSHHSDGRAVVISMTAKGRRLYERALKSALEQLIVALHDMGPAELGALAELLSEVRRACQTHDSAARRDP